MRRQAGERRVLENIGEADQPFQARLHGEIIRRRRQQRAGNNSLLQRRDLRFISRKTYIFDVLVGIDLVQLQQRFGSCRRRAAEGHSEFLASEIGDLLNIRCHHHGERRPTHLLRQDHDIVAFPHRRHLRPDGKDEMDLVGEQRLHRRRRAAHEDQFQIQSLAFVKTSFRRHHHRQNLNARRWKRAAHRLALSLSSGSENKNQSNENDSPHRDLLCSA